MPTIQIRDVPLELYNKLIESAEKSRRSLTQQAIILLEEAIISESIKTSKHGVIMKIQELNLKEPIFSIQKVMKWIQEEREN